MSTNSAHGFDVVFEVTETAVRDLLESAELIPAYRDSLDPTVGSVHLSAEVEIFRAVPGPETPEAEFEFVADIENGVSVRLPLVVNFHNLHIDGADGDFPSEGLMRLRLRLRHALNNFTNDAGQRCIGMQFDSTFAPGRIDVTIDEMPEIGIPDSIVESLMEQFLYEHLRTNVGQLELYAITPSGDSDPFTPNDIDVRTINDECLALLVDTCSESVGNADAFAASEIPSGANSVLLIGNHLLLGHLVCPFLLEALEDPRDPAAAFDFDENRCSLNAPISLNHLLAHDLVEDSSLNSLNVAVEEDHLHISGEAAIRGSVFRATVGLEANLFVSIDSAGNIAWHTEMSEPEIDLTMDWWIYVLFTLGFILFPDLGFLATAILLPILAVRLRDMLTEALRGGLPSGTEAMPGLPFGMTIDSVHLDDLTAVGYGFCTEPSFDDGPSLRLISNVDTGTTRVAGSEERTHFGGAVVETRLTVENSSEGSFCATTSRMLNPIAFAWSLAGRAFEPGSHTALIGDTRVHYQVDRHRCSIQLDEGESLEAYLNVSATDSRGVVLTADEWIDVEGTREIRSFTGVEVLEGPALLKFLTYIEDTRSPVDSSLIDRGPARCFAEQLQIGVANGTGVRLPQNSFLPSSGRVQEIREPLD